MKIQKMEDTSAFSKAILTLRPIQEKGAPRRQIRDDFEIAPQTSGQAPPTLAQLFEASQNRVAGGNWLLAILEVLQILGLFAKSLDNLSTQIGPAKIDENAAPVRGFVETSRRIIEQIGSCPDEASIDALLSNLEGQTLSIPGSTRVQQAMAEVHAAARKSKHELTKVARDQATARIQELTEKSEQQLRGLVSKFEALSVKERRERQGQFDQDYAWASELAKDELRRAAEELKARTEAVEQQGKLAETAQGAARAAKGAADQAAVSSNASMPSATSKIPVTSGNSRPRPTGKVRSSSGVDATDVVTFISLVAPALADLRQAPNNNEVRRILRDHDVNKTLATMSLRGRDVCFTMLWQELKRGGDLNRLVQELLST